MPMVGIAQGWPLTPTLPPLLIKDGEREQMLPLFLEERGAIAMINAP